MSLDSGSGCAVCGGFPCSALRSGTYREEFAMFLARDKNNDLYLFDKLPLKGAECWWAESGVDGTYLRLDKSLYPEITWDSAPVPAELLISGKEQRG